MDEIFSADRLTVEMDNLFNWIVERSDILGYKINTWGRDSANSQAISEFLSGQGPKTLSICQDEALQLSLVCSDVISISAPPTGIKAYFIRSSQSILTAESIHKSVMYGTVGGSGLTIASLERFMKGLVEKQISTNNELSWHYHRLMATLTDTIHSSDNRTFLYCPNFEFKSVVDAAQDKEKLQIMESIVIHWTRQIKDVVNSHENSASAESSGPLDEIEFWKVRAEDLLGIQRQLEVDTVTRIIEVLEYAKSNYIGPFRNRTQEILTRAAEANDNLKFLETIRDQCTALRTIDAEKIVSILPDLLNRIRLVWVYSAYYSSNDHISGILRKISNEIIRRFRSYIKVDQVIDGNVDTSIKRLLQAIECGTHWKTCYHSTANAIDRQKAKYSNRVWNMDDASIFAQIDAFVQRCRDLVDICECQIQFIRKSPATKSMPGPLPKFGGTKAQEIVDGILGIQASFEQRVDRIRKLEYDVLDVRMSKWHEDYHNFKNSVKDLEVMFTNVINAAFDNNSTVAEGVILTETFRLLAKRDVIKRCVERKASEVLHLFFKQVQSSRSEFELSRLNPPLRMLEPQYAGSALWAQSLAALVKESYDNIVRIESILDARDFEEVREAYNTFITVIKEFKLSRYNIWLEDLTEKAKDNGLHVRLDKPLLRRAEMCDTTASKTGTEVVSNFDEYLLSIFAEVSHWEKLQGEFTIPYIAHDICNKKENLRIMRENVMLLVRAYNDIVHDISADERRLFIDHIRRLDRKITPGLNKITWQSRNLIDIYVRECCSSCHELANVIAEFKDTKQIIHRVCKQISSTMLVRVDKNQVYEGDIFEGKQRDFRANVVKLFDGYYNKMMNPLKNVYRNFKDGPTEVQREWKSQVVQVFSYSNLLRDRSVTLIVV
jgi:dynein heavy chain, axonemal